MNNGNQVDTIMSWLSIATPKQCQAAAPTGLTAHQMAAVRHTVPWPCAGSVLQASWYEAEAPLKVASWGTAGAMLS